MKAILYARVSTDDQVKSGLGMEAQLNASKRYAYTMKAKKVLVFRDEGKCGALPPQERPGLIRAIIAIEKGDMFIVAKRDRLARNLMHAQIIESMVKGRGGLLYSADGVSSEDSPAGFLQRSIVDAFAQYERMMISVRTKEALAVKKAKFERIGAVPYGWDLADDGVHLIENPTEQATIVWIVKTRQAGISYRKIATALNAEKVPTKNPNGQWYHSGVLNICKREIKSSKDVG